MNTDQLKAEIKRLKQEKNVLILSHYYARPEVQDIADYIGDSLGLSRQAAHTDADIILFCGVHFMAETASIISPNKKILSPTGYAGCSLAEGMMADDIRVWKKDHPQGIVVSYVNTTAEVKSETDYCCTSSNALKVVQSLPKDKPILFGPDRNLGAYISRVTGRAMDIWQGACFVHDRIDEQSILQAVKDYPEADILIHPESLGAHSEEVLSSGRCFMYSTAGILDHARKSSKKQFVIATEPDTLHILRKECPHKTFIALQPESICHYMKQGGLWEVKEALEKEQYEVKVPESLRARAYIPIERMLNIG